MVSSIGSPLLWSGFALLVAVLLALDLGVFHRHPHKIGFREAVGWSIAWITISLLFNLWLYLEFGARPGLEFLAGYVIEKALSVDNIFVFLVIFRYFAVPARFQHRVLFWGILGAVFLRGTFIVLGTTLISTFHWILYLFGVFLVITGARVLLDRESEVHPERNPVVRLFRRIAPMTSDYRDKHFFVREAGRRFATPLLLVLVVVEATDIVFAVDSIPAIFAVTLDPFLIFTSNILAILGLRALYFVLADLMERFRFLRVGLGFVLAFVGIKMLISELYEIPIETSLGVVVALLTGSILVSWLLPPGEEQAPPGG